MSAAPRPYLFDVTRLISRSWTARQATGIDRVCYAYLDRFGPNSRAVLQHRGVVRVLGGKLTDQLYKALRGPDRKFRRRLSAIAPQILAGTPGRAYQPGAIYLNVSHTDFDLQSHSDWVRAEGLRSVYFLHDLIPITHPEMCRTRAIRRHTGRVRAALSNATGVIVNSNCTAQQLVLYARDQQLPLPPAIVAPLAPPPALGELAKEAAPCDAEPGTGVEPYFLTVGTIEPRKNHAMLLQVWRSLIDQLGDKMPRLVIVGQPGWSSERVLSSLKRDPVLRDKVTLISSCSDREMVRLLEGAIALLKPSHAEGFGLPVVEALELGTPVIASDIPSFREIGQGIPLLLDPSDRSAWEKAIARYTDPFSDRDRQMALIGAFRPPSWDKHFSTVENWLAGLGARTVHRLELEPQRPMSIEGIRSRA